MSINNTDHGIEWSYCPLLLITLNQCIFSFYLLEGPNWQLERIISEQIWLLCLLGFSWQTYVEDMQKVLQDKNWKVRTTICWGQRDRWLSFDGVEDFCKDSNHSLIEVPRVNTKLFYSTCLRKGNMLLFPCCLWINLLSNEYLPSIILLSFHRDHILSLWHKGC